MTETATASPPVLEADPLSGTAYRVVRRIGAGAMGQVFEAEHIGLGRRVAVKLLHPSLAGDPIFVDRLRLEAQALASVRHPNVVLVHDHATTPAGAPFLAMELLRGRTLQSLLRERGALPLLEALGLIDQAFAGLMAIHAAGLTHRDLKPANIFLSDERGRTVLKLLDFGIVKVTPQDGSPSIAPLRFPTREGHVLGTPRCMAPEQIMGQACDARTDVYASAVLLFLLVAGRDPFHEYRTHLEILSAHLTEDPPALSKVAAQHIPPCMDAVVARALAKEPGARFASIAAFGAALSASLGGAQGVRPVATHGTEKMAASSFRSAPAKTAPIDPAVLRAGDSALPFAPADGPDDAVTLPRAMPDASREPLPAGPVKRLPPSFGLPLLAPVATQQAAPSLPVRRAGLAPAPSGDGASRAATEDNHLLYGVVALLWCLLALVAWKVL